MLLMLTMLSIPAQGTVKARFSRPAWITPAFVANPDAHPAEDNEVDVPFLKGPRKVGSQATAPLKAKGSPLVPVILVQFSDLHFTSGLGTDAEGKPVQCQSEADEAVVNNLFNLFCNGKGDGSYYTGTGSNGSITEYFRDQSDGQFTPRFVVIGPVTLDSVYSYYGKNKPSKDANLSKFYEQAIKKAQAKFSEWSQFDNDGNGTVDMAFFVYAGEGENGGGGAETIWPQEQSSGGTINDTSYGCYACCNETYKGVIDGIGVFVHELSHALGLPDLYDKNYKLYGLDYWDVMDSGCYCHDGYCPCNYSAYEREFMGWTRLETLDPDEPRELTLYHSSSFYTHDYEWNAYKIVNPANANEYYVIENRQPTGWDLYIGRGNDVNKMKGMIIFHVDYIANRWSSNTVNTQATQLLTIRPADGVLHSYMDVNDMDKYTQWMFSTYGDLYPGYYKVTSFKGEQQVVRTKTGENPGQMGQPLYDISLSDDGVISLYYMQGPRPVGDVNGDGLVNITDVVMAVNIIAAGEYNDDADLNGDRSVNITDVVSIINIIAGN